MEVYVFDRDTNVINPNGRQIFTFNNLSIRRNFNSVGSTFSFDFLLDINNPDHQLVSNMTRHQLIKIDENGKRMFTGFIVKIEKKHSAKSTYTKVSGYSIPAVLGESQVPVSTYPRQHNNLSLREIVTKILRPFKITLIVDDSVNTEVDRVYDKSSCTVSETALNYIESLAKQRDVLVTHTSGGAMLLTKAKYDKQPIIDVDFTYPIEEADLVWDGSGIHSRINVLGESSENTTTPRDAELFTDLVPKWTTKFNPKVVEQSSGDDIDTIKIAQQIRAAELRNIQLTLYCKTWHINNQLIEPNNTITIKSKELGLLEKTTWFIERVDYTYNEKETTCVLHCVLPEVYNGKEPVNVFI